MIFNDFEVEVLDMTDSIWPYGSGHEWWVERKGLYEAATQLHWHKFLVSEFPDVGFFTFRRL